MSLMLMGFIIILEEVRDQHHKRQFSEGLTLLLC